MFLEPHARAGPPPTLVDLDVLQRLQRRVGLLPRVEPDAQVVLFSESGYTPRVEAARTSYMLTLTLDDLLP